MVGAGWVARQHAAGIAAVCAGRAEVVAVCDPDPAAREAFAVEHAGVEPFGGVEDLLDHAAAGAGVDVLLVLTPPAVRDEVVDPALERGVALLVEKPFAPRGAHAVELVRRAEAAGVPLAVSQNFRWYPEQQWLADRVRSGELGPLHLLEHRSFQDRPQAPGVWRASEQRLEMAIFSVHLIDRLQWLAASPPRTVSALTRRDPASGLPGEQLAALLVSFEDGLLATMTSSWRARGLPTQELRADGEHGSARTSREHPMAGPALGELQLRGDEVVEASFVDAGPVTRAHLSYGSSTAALLDALDAGVEAPHSGRDNLRTMGVMDAAYLSASRGGAAVDVEEALGGEVLAGPGAVWR
ncbi:Gfo/Idh/MocA family oxidoreductase [Streptomyces sp. NP160]|nr:Gfo/Idh/MocA family oxidoreductase [Streptomyces sp. NP160]